MSNHPHHPHHPKHSFDGNEIVGGGAKGRIVPATASSSSFLSGWPPGMVGGPFGPAPLAPGMSVAGGPPQPASPPFFAGANANFAFSPAAASSATPLTGTAVKPGGTRTAAAAATALPVRSNPLPSADRILLLMILDYLRRAGLSVTASQLMAEARVDFYSAETAAAMGMMETVSQLHGRNPQPGGIDGGFLRDWWATFWQMYQARIPAGFKPPPPLSSSASTTSASVSVSVSSQASSTSPTIMDGVAPDAQAAAQLQMHMHMKMAIEARKKMILSAMSSLGLEGRDPQSLTPEEQQLVSLTIQKQMAAKMAPAPSPYPPPGSLVSTGAGGDGEAPRKKQRLMDSQTLRMASASLQSPSSSSTGPPLQPAGTPTAFVSGRPILPAAPTPPPPKSPPAPPMTRSVPHPNSLESRDRPHSELDESALLSFFGTPADWLATDRYLVSPSEDHHHHHHHPHPHPYGGGGEASVVTSALPIDASALKIEGLNEQPETRIPVQRPSSRGDPNDLLLVTESRELPRHPTRDLHSALSLHEACDLGQHLAGTKAVSTSISADGLFLASGGHDRRILVFALVQDQRQLAIVLEGHHSQQITQVRFSSDGDRRWLASSSFDKTVHIWDLGRVDDPTLPDHLQEDGPQFILRDVHDERIWSIDFLPISTPAEPRRLASIDAAGKLVLWQLPALGNERSSPMTLFTTTVKSTDDHVVTVRQIKARPSSSTAPGRPALLAIANGSRVELFDCDKHECIEAPLLLPSPSPEPKGKAIVAINWGDGSQSDTLLAATTESVAIWDLASLQGASVSRPPPSPSLSLSLSATSTSSCARPIASAIIPADKLTCCLLLRDSGCVLLGGYKGIYLWEYHRTTTSQLPPRRPLKFSAHEGLVVSLSVSRTGPLLVGSASHDGRVKLWSVQGSDAYY